MSKIVEMLDVSTQASRRDMIEDIIGFIAFGVFVATVLGVSVF